MATGCVVRVIRYYISENGMLKEVDKERLEEAIWIDLVAPNPDEAEFIARKFDIDLQDIADCLDPNERSRVEIAEDYDLVVLRSILADASDQDRIDTIPIGVLLTQQKVLTIRVGATFLGAEVTSDLKRRPPISTKEEVFLAIIQRIIRDIEHRIRPVERRIAYIQETILSVRRRDVAKGAFALSNSLILLNTALLSDLNAMSMLPKARNLQMTGDKKDLLEAVENDVAQLYEMTTIYREIMSNILNAYEFAESNQLSTIMKTLTTISLILILPTLLASLYGMNVSLPFEGDPNAFWIVIGLSAVAVAGLWVMLRLKHIL
ncbi:MAG: magnesium transporter CorA family protein [Methanobacteriota archaeon]|nr:MAG: magnesium transporter CorA family protein [Euryarchaeota archaeon]